VEQPGRIRIVQNGALIPQPFLDITDRVLAGGEQGLLSVAFHPQYASNGLFYVNYTDRNGDTRIERFSVSADPNVADVASGTLILGVDQPFPNHNGGLVTFGPDGMLYIGMGDGGDAGDPFGNGQNLGTLLGKILRIDVGGGGAPYAIPSDNPFVAREGARAEIWAFGLRNPWRFDFDPQTGELYVADVGQDEREEINVVRAETGALNYGWDIMEGSSCYSDNSCERDGLVLPVLEYGRRSGCSIIGGYVYRGSLVPEIVGHYFYSDYCSGWIRSFKYEGGTVTDSRQWDVGSIGNVLSFGEDAVGELYVLSSNGRVYRVVPAS
jgi:glucose/arabinose dehydrogenase